ncbi:MAG: hypothetical protein M1835_001156 [Candelina submexicana]|nr:MAG: hypothetical protein M1835_001156 [Candelina submexicana]
MFAKADVAYAEKELKTKYNVNAEPTWVNIKKGTGAVETYVGADPNKLEEAVLRHAGPGDTQGGFGWGWRRWMG